MLFHKSKLKKMATFQKLIELHEKNQKLKLDMNLFKSLKLKF